LRWLNLAAPSYWLYQLDAGDAVRIQISLTTGVENAISLRIHLYHPVPDCASGGGQYAQSFARNPESKQIDEFKVAP
jgi:hypothetical protein